MNSIQKDKFQTKILNEVVSFMSDQYQNLLIFKDRAQTYIDDLSNGEMLICVKLPVGNYDINLLPDTDPIIKDMEIVLEKVFNQTELKNQYHQSPFIRYEYYGDMLYMFFVFDQIQKGGEYGN